VRIVDPAHPHFRETGIWTGKLIRFTFPPYDQLAHITLDHCRHGVESCYVSPGQIEQD